MERLTRLLLYILILTPLCSLEINLNGDYYSYYSREYFEENYMDKCYLEELTPAMAELTDILVFNGKNHFRYNSVENAWLIYKNESLSLFIDDIEIPFVEEIDIRGEKLTRRNLHFWLKKKSALSDEILFFARNKDIPVTITYYEEIEKELIHNKVKPDLAEIDNRDLSRLLYRGFDFNNYAYTPNKEFKNRGMILAEPLSESSLKLLSRQENALEEFTSETPVYMNIREFYGILPYIAGINLYGDLSQSEELAAVLTELREHIRTKKIIAVTEKELLPLLKNGEYIIADSRLTEKTQLNCHIYDLPSFREKPLPALLFTRGLTVTSDNNRETKEILFRYLRLPTVQQRISSSQGDTPWNTLRGFYLPVSRDSWIFNEIMDSAFRLLLTDVFPAETVLKEAQKAFKEMQKQGLKPDIPL